MLDSITSTSSAISISSSNNSVPVPEKWNGNDLKLVIIQDLIMLLFDLSSIVSSNILSMDDDDDVDDNDEPIELFIFNNIHSIKNNTATTNAANNPNSGETFLTINNENELNENNPQNQKEIETNSYTIEITSMDSVLSLQRGVYHALFQFLIMTYSRSTTRLSDEYLQNELSSFRQKNGENDDDDFRDLRRESRIMDIYHGSVMNFAPFLHNGEIRSMILAGIRQVLEMKLSLDVDTRNNKNQSILQPSDTPLLTTILLSLRNKVMTANFLLLLLPDLSWVAKDHHFCLSSTSSLWNELMTLIVNCTISHFEFMSSTLIPLLKEERMTNGSTINMNNNNNNNQNSRSNLYHPIQDLTISFSSMIVNLMTNIYIYPMKPFTPHSDTIWSLRSKFVCSLLECIPHIHVLLDSIHDSSSSLYRSIKDISIVTLRAIHLSFFPDVGIIGDNGDNDDEAIDPMTAKSPIDGLGYESQDLIMMKIMICDHCHVRNIYSSMFNLVQNVSTTTIMVSILTQLVVYDDDPVFSQRRLVLSQVCDSIINIDCNQQVEHRKNKRRRLDRKNPGGALYHLQGTDNVDSTFVSSISSFLQSALDDAKRIKRSMETIEDILHLNPIEITNIMSAIRLIHSVIGFDSYSDVQEAIRRFSDDDNGGIRAILSKLNHAANKVSKSINDALSTDDVSIDSYHFISAIMEAYLCVGSHAPSLIQYHALNDVPQDLKDLSTSISNTSMNFVLTSHDDEFELLADAIGEGSSLPPFDSRIVQLLRSDYIKELKEIYSRCQRGGGGALSSRISSYLDSFRISENLCEWDFAGLIGKEFRTFNESYFIELMCTTKQR